MSAGVVFFSRSNNTRVGAEYLAAKLGAELIELVEVKGRRGLGGFIRSGYQAVSGKFSQLRGEPWSAAGKYSSLYLLTPIWGGKTTPAMNTFLQEMDFESREVTAITFQAGEKGEGSSKVYEYIREIVEKSGGYFAGGYAMHSAAPGRFAGKEYIEKQLEDKFLKHTRK